VSIRHRSFTSFEATLGNPSLTCFTMKQTSRCRCVFSHRLYLLIGFEAQTDKPPPLGFDVQTKKLSRWFWGINHQTVAVVLRANHQTIDLGFEARTKKPSQWFWGHTTDKPSPPIFMLNRETRASHLLHVYDADRTRHHPTSHSFDHRVPDLSLIILDPLHQVSYSYLDPYHCPSCRICHLYITRQANTFLHTK
jgi:hypothetical protein